jgi:hypothetical protein
MVEPLSPFHPLKALCNLIRVVLDNSFNVPNLRALNIRPIAQKDIQLHLPILILEDVVPVPLDGCEKFKATLG